MPTLQPFAAGVLALALVALAVAGCREEGVPDVLLGRWATNDPRYADRSLSIDRATIAFGMGEAVSEVHAIDGVDTQELGGSAVHTVRYRESDGAVGSLSLEMVPGPRPALRIENHDELWIRQDGRR